MGVDRVQEELQQLNQLKQVCITYIMNILAGFECVSIGCQKLQKLVNVFDFQAFSFDILCTRSIK